MIEFIVLVIVAILAIWKIPANDPNVRETEQKRLGLALSITMTCFIFMAFIAFAGPRFLLDINSDGDLSHRYSIIAVLIQDSN